MDNLLTLGNDTPVIDTPPAPSAQDEQQAALDALINGYNEAKIITVDKTPEVTPAPAPTITPAPAQTFTPVTTPAPTGDLDAPFGRFANGKPRKRPAKPQAAPIVQVGTIQPPPPPPPAALSGAIIDGALFLLMIDVLFPLLISVINNRFTDIKVNPEKLQLTEKQKRDLAPLADAVMKQVQLRGNPTVLLLLSLLGVYSVNLIGIHFAEKAKQKIKPNAQAVS